ncbi:transglutaminase domain-containing protein [Pontibacter burrus]|uniref:Transglutaminase-like domain-containing protein n=1 Tax=Pontibacter burrus TaxID=2704466 RepID=A0A6B3LZP4_9BACT|nr:transglutaminase domain-containing protein [Pontibacter burrus]NEM99150.1 hypothetical protein [Pontibacter burrus]
MFQALLHLARRQFSIFIIACSIVAIQPAMAGNSLPDNSRMQQLDQFAHKTDPRYTTSVPQLAAYLSKAAATDYEKARVIFAWIAKNIRYDDNGFNTGKVMDASPEAVLKYRRAVCDGYARLFQALGEEMGLDVVKVSGYAKGYGYAPGKRFPRTNHAWNAVRLNDRWMLLDPTWAAGSATTANGKLKTIYRYDPYWFDVEPHAFLFSHLPVKPEYQFIPKPITLAQYEQLAFVEASIFRLGANGADVLYNLLKGKLKSLPKTWKSDLDVQLADVPLEGRLTPGRNYTFAIKAADDVELILKNGKNWHHFEPKGNVHMLQLRPVDGDVAIMARKKGTKVNYNYFLEYKAVK